MDWNIFEIIDGNTIAVVADDSRSAMQQIMDRHPGGNLVLKATEKGSVWRYSVGTLVFELSATDL